MELLRKCIIHFVYNHIEKRSKFFVVFYCFWHVMFLVKIVELRENPELKQMIIF